MFIIHSVDGPKAPIRLSRGAIVSLLVLVAVYANAKSWQRIEEIKREVRFQQQLHDGLDELTQAADAVAAHRK